MSQQSGSQERDLNRRILEKVTTDPQFRKQLLDDPEQAIADSEFAQEADQLKQGQTSRPITGQAAGAFCTWTSCTWTGH